MDQPKIVDVLVVGAGFSGLGAAIRLAQEGFDDLVVLERGPDVGGTWRDNSYPGAACDVPSHLYSYSFALNPDWSRAFSPQGEIYDYIRKVTHEAGVREKIRFGVDVTSVDYDESRGRWTVRTSEEEYDARVVVLGVGALCEPRLPEIDGVGDFAGPVFHTARWDHSVTLADKRVAVIGTGASAIQVVPSIAPTVAHLDVYQRTAPWVLPRMDRQYPRFERSLYRRVPGLQRAVRALQYASREFQVVGLTRTRAALAPIKALGRAHLAMQVRDRALRARLTPHFEIGCKRILLSNTWYPALSRDNVDVVTEPITRVTERGIVTGDGTEHPADVLVVATGFHVTDSPFFERVRGTDGRTLADKWQSEGMEAYKGTTVAGYPNLFVLVGPATGLGHSSMIYMIESQLNYLVDALRTMRDRGLQTVEVRAAVQDAYNRELRDSTGETVWVTGCRSWYLDDKGNAPAVWPDYTFTFRNQTREFDLSAYRRTAADATAATRTGQEALR
ncbi:cation diffusion facilitator CzcD-associated flavoprotein CzcO [Dietzia kunjamensis]|uniref:flavin-containing monooxygenase n=1 Tax=Dietzia kunjamensis TaxID=322509 RepID=UPI000E7621B0|nr:NAD(P)/FAD-dependent oxidoreductase [Dietzia kunjamensis]MBB1012105.1 NAD(P)/FAD-dependent oxidoreductase [Dietzia kunjamensis]RKE59716.1 cation diffusion facilitator CzcD-associated flavoprotein CzcO [Dietzia kunjamensis]